MKEKNHIKKMSELFEVNTPAISKHTKQNIIIQDRNYVSDFDKEILKITKSKNNKN